MESRLDPAMRKKILIIDDEKPLCEAAVDFLTDVGYDARYALDGKTGLSMIEDYHPALLLLDIQMPEMNGLEVLKQLSTRFPDLQVVVISGFLDKEMTQKVIECGAAMSVDKPFKLEGLVIGVIKPLIGPPHL